MNLNTNLKRSSTEVEHTIAGVQIVEASKFISGELIHQTYTLQISGSKSKESSLLPIAVLWKTFLERVQNSISGSSFNETTGPQTSTLNAIPNGHYVTGAVPQSGQSQWIGYSPYGVGSDNQYVAAFGGPVSADS